MNLGDDDSRTETPGDGPPVFAASERMVRVAADRIDSAELFHTAREIMIVHGGDIYRLRLTAQNKLILTK